MIIELGLIRKDVVHLEMNIYAKKRTNPRNGDVVRRKESGGQWGAPDFVIMPSKKWGRGENQGVTYSLATAHNAASSLANIVRRSLQSLWICVYEHGVFIKIAAKLHIIIYLMRT